MPGGNANATLRHMPAPQRHETITVEEVRNEADLQALAAAWDDLLAQSTSNVLFLTHAWVTCWWRHFGRAKCLQGRVQLFVLTLWRGGRLCGVAPLIIEVERFLGVSARLVRFLGHGVSDYADFILAEDHELLLQAMVQHLVRRSAVWDMLDLRDVYGASATLSLLRNLFGAAGLVPHIASDHSCPFLPVTGPWETFYRHRFNSQQRNRHRRQWRNLQLASQPTIRFVTSLGAEPDLIEQLGEVERHHPEAAGNRPGVFNIGRYRGFLAEVLPQLAQRGWLSIVLLECDGHIVAYYLGFRYNRRYYLYTTSYRQEFGRFGVGRLLMLRMLEHYWRSEGDEIDFLRGDEPYKHAWAVQARQNERWLVGQRSWQSRIRTWVWLVLRPAWQRRFPRLHGILSFISEHNWLVVLRWLWRRLRGQRSHA